MGVDFLVVWMARLALKRQRFHVWGSSLRRWRWLAILLALVPLAQLAVSTQTAQRFLYVDLDWWNSAPLWFRLYENSLAAQTGFYALFFLAPPLAAVWLRMPPGDAEQWSLRWTWALACTLSAG